MRLCHAGLLPLAAVPQCIPMAVGFSQPILNITVTLQRVLDEQQSYGEYDRQGADQSGLHNLHIAIPPVILVSDC